MYYAYQPYHASVTSRIHVTFSFQLISCENVIHFGRRTLGNSGFFLDGQKQYDFFEYLRGFIRTRTIL
ncbi:unnamed protein product [Rhizophagus irregularis]|uniref:Uncharacterized protein n=1 Tax=Rhizophagus irregularis TaxID=588596 RepID=A0A916EJ76_9GLOM|nr:unnamed protein product [Rhizophagus irregularis]CAB5395155.1 unnamed protein product [Rhizophagus irregularis]